MLTIQRLYHATRLICCGDFRRAKFLTASAFRSIFCGGL